MCANLLGNLTKVHVINYRFVECSILITILLEEIDSQWEAQLTDNSLIFSWQEIEWRLFLIFPGIFQGIGSELNDNCRQICVFGANVEVTPFARCREKMRRKRPSVVSDKCKLLCGVCKKTDQLTLHLSLLLCVCVWLALASLSCITKKTHARFVCVNLWDLQPFYLFIWTV